MRDISDGARLRRVAIGISSQLLSSLVEVTPVDERIMSEAESHLGLHVLRCSVRS